MTAALTQAPAAAWKASRPPIEVLREKAAALEADTNGVLRGELGEYPREDGGYCRLWFDIATPALGASRNGALVVLHGTESPYPAIVDARVFEDEGAPRLGEWMRQGLDTSAIPYTENRANSDDELAAIVKRVFESPYIVSVMQSRIARATGQAPPD